MKIKDLFLQKYQSRMSKRQVCFVPWDDMHRVAILTDVPQNDEIQKIVQQLQQNKKRVTVINKCEPKQVCRLLERPKKNVLTELGKEHYDLLLDFSVNSDMVMQYMALSIYADLKVGRYVVDGIYDLNMNMPPQSGAYALFEQMVKYIHMFKG